MKILIFVTAEARRGKFKVKKEQKRCGKAFTQSGICYFYFFIENYNKKQILSTKRFEMSINVIYFLKVGGGGGG